MKSFTRNLCLSLVSVAILGGTALASPANLPDFDQVSKDNDRVISKHEAVQANIPAEFFLRADQNHDGVLQKEEYDKLKAEKAPETAAK
ncbi:hypothetical protein DESUT3_13030 [Desulfuromonas versatilis]|uniref:EF-hand domain-containing protein n=1 Tax=Desulfuromonas versatilis TaxID=2802975 RepID=A0ABN6DYF4_9BACT|nr:hypothetical protein [Desulfuromonas versatilis]BCR04234.1 hypothetical protein DESUT3_13030 [Desulfuromonas versatilis]